MRFAAHVFTFALALLTLSACETVTETLIINETGTGSLLIDWTFSEQQLLDLGVPDLAGKPINRSELGSTIDEAFGTEGYVLSDRAAFNVFRGDRTGFTITKPIRNLEDVRSLGTEDLQSGRPPIVLWRDIQLIESDEGSLSLAATPSVADRQALLDFVAVQEDVVFVAAFSPRGQINSHNADEVDGNTLRWRVEDATPRTFEVDWTPKAPDTQSALPFLAGLLVVIFAAALLLYFFDKRNLDRHAKPQTGSDPGSDPNVIG